MRKALIVGIDAYETAPLRSSVNDATAMAELLRTHENGDRNFSVELFTNLKSKLLLKMKIEELFQGPPSEVALFYFAGHGLLNAFGGYLVTPDHRSYDEGVSMEDILKLAVQSKAQNKIIILDCCHSGAFGSPQLSSGAAHLTEGMVILTASRDVEKAVEVHGHGIFTNLLLDALQGGAADLCGFITPGSVYAYIDRALGDWEQRPAFKTNVIRFISLRRVKPTISMEHLRKLKDYFLTPGYQFPLDPSYEYTNEGVAIPEHISIFKILQKYASLGLVVPVEEEFMYWAAQNSKACTLTALGCHYWRLAKEGLL